MTRELRAAEVEHVREDRGPRKAVWPGAKTAPRRATANGSSAASRQFGSSVATCAPGATPSRASPCASSVASRVGGRERPLPAGHAQEHVGRRG